MPSTCFLAPSLLPLLSAPQHPGVPKWGCEGPGQGVPGGGCSQRVLPAGQDGHLLTATTTLEYDSTYADEEEEEEEEDYEATPEQPAADGELRRGRGAGLPRATSTTSPRPRVPTASPCGQPLEEGGCERYTLRWYYSQRGAECRPFVYSGCGGNANRFGSRRDCELRCGGHAGTGRHGTTQHSLAPRGENALIPPRLSP